MAFEVGDFVVLKETEKPTLQRILRGIMKVTYVNHRGHDVIAVSSDIASESTGNTWSGNRFYNLGKCVSKLEQAIYGIE